MACINISSSSAASLLSATQNNNKWRQSQLPYYSSSSYSYLPSTTINPNFTAIRSQSKFRVFNFTRSTKLRSTTKIRACQSWAADSDGLASDVRKQAMDAIDLGGRRVSLGDVVSTSTLDFNQAQQALHALAADTNGYLQVSDEADVVYVFPKNYQFKLAANSFRIKIESLWEMVKRAAATLVKVSFGLSAAVCLVNPPNMILFVAAIFQNDDMILSEAIRYGFSTLYGGGFSKYVFSFVFGDGNPNQWIEEKKWKMISQYIALNGGVVTAEELAPYLDPATTKKMDNDSYMLPVLLRLNGHPEVDEEGNIIYHFPLVGNIASPKRSKGKEYVGKYAAACCTVVEKFLREEKWIYRKVGTSDIMLVNFFLVWNQLWAYILLHILNHYLSLADSSIGSIMYGICFRSAQMFSTYVSSFIVIQLVQVVLIREPNAAIAKRNAAREQFAEVLESPDISLKRKLLSARNMARRRSASSGKEKVVTSTETDVCDQYDYDGREWDRRFKDRWNCVPNSC